MIMEAVFKAYVCLFVQCVSPNLKRKCSLSNNAKLLEQSVRSHWGIENSLHWGKVSAGEASLAKPPLLDVAWGEDECRLRKDNAPENFAVLRHIAVNFLGRGKSSKLGVKNILAFTQSLYK